VYLYIHSLIKGHETVCAYIDPSRVRFDDDGNGYNITNMDITRAAALSEA
jgi:hypothetical protein